MKTYDVVVLGAGSAGLTVAYTAIGLKQKVLVVEKDKPGGECTWSGCVPSKSLISEAEKTYHIRRLLPEYEFDSKAVFEHINRVRASIYDHESPEQLIKDGIAYLSGEAKFINRNQIMVGESIVKGKRFYVCTGSSPVIPPINGLNEVPFLTNETVFEIKELPHSLVIIGGGPIGIELAQAFNRLGVSVQVIEMQNDILMNEEIELIASLKEILMEEGVVIHTNTTVDKVSLSKDGIIEVHTQNKTINKLIKGERLLISVGRKPNIAPLELSSADVSFNDKGIVVNKYMQTTNKNIYAVGDVVGPYRFSHMANVQGIAAAMNGILPFKKKVSQEHVSWVTYTKPELARAGFTEDEAKKRYKGVRVYRYDFNDLDRAKTKGETKEQLKLILSKSGKVLGASILADRAGEMIGEIQLLKMLRKNFSVMRKVIHPYPTYSEVFTKIGKRVAVDNIVQNPIVKFFTKG